MMQLILVQSFCALVTLTNFWWIPDLISFFGVQETNNVRAEVLREIISTVLIKRTA